MRRGNAKKMGGWVAGGRQDVVEGRGHREEGREKWGGKSGGRRGEDVERGREEGAIKWGGTEGAKSGEVGEMGKRKDPAAPRQTTQETCDPSRRENFEGWISTF